MRRNPTVVFVGPRQVAVEDRDVPKPEAGQLLVRTHCTLVSTGTELSLLEGDMPAGELWTSLRDYPCEPGYSNVGTVEDVGEGIERSWIGRRVVCWGTHTGYALVSDAHCWEVSADIGDEQATFVVLAGIALNGVRKSRLVFGESAVVYGLGLLGQLVVQICHHAGVRPVFGVDTSGRRVGLLPERSGIVGVVAGREDPVDVVKEGTKGRMADVVFELTGNGDLIPTEFPALRRQGRFVVLSSPRSATTFDFHDLCNSPSHTIIGAHNSSHPPVETPDNPWTLARHCEQFFRMVGDGDFDVGRLISHRADVADAPELYDMLMADRTQAMGVILRWPTA